jgi:hypothetical protein
MTLTKTELKGLKAEGTKLEKKVINVLLDQGSSSDIENYIQDLLQHGCQSGMVSELIYYSDTTEFFQKYKKDIVNLLNETMDSTGASSPAEVFGEKWDNEDPLAEDSSNQNLLAWFGFEETVYRLANALEMDI